MSDTRNVLVEVAAELVDEGGPATVTLREVGRRAGVSHNAPYRHFADKQDLLAAVAARELRTLVAAMTAAVPPNATGLAAVGAVAVAYLDWALGHPARFKLTFSRWDIDHPELGEAAAAAAAAIRRSVAAAHADGSLTGDPELTALLVHAAGHGAVDLALGGHLGKGAAITPSDLVGYLLERLATGGRDAGS